MQAYRDFINTIRFQPNPNQRLDRSLPASFAGGDPVAGRNAFLNTNYQGVGVLGLKCNTCHTVPAGTDRSFTPAAALGEPQSFKVPHLREIYQKMTFTNTPGAETIAGFGIVHDGQDASLFEFLSRSVFGVFSDDSVVKRNVSAFVQCFDTGMAPAVGYGRTLSPLTVDAASVSNDWRLLESQATVLTNIDLVAKGTVDGVSRGFLFQPASATYRPDTTNLPAMTHGQLRAKVLSGDTLTLLGVPPGSGMRLGIDRNLDGQLDGDLPPPRLQVTKVSSNAVVSWSTNAAAFVLEQSAQLPTGPWAIDVNPRGLAAGDFTVTNILTGTNVFFRLRGF
jgi:hypothetical protein